MVQDKKDDKNKTFVHFMVSTSSVYLRNEHRKQLLPLLRKKSISSQALQLNYEELHEDQLASLLLLFEKWTPKCTNIAHLYFSNL